MLEANTKVKIGNKTYIVLDVSEFGAKIRPIVKVGRGTYKVQPKTREIFVSVNTDAKVIK